MSKLATLKSLAQRATSRPRQRKGFNPSQPRDERGRWTRSSGSGMEVEADLLGAPGSKGRSQWAGKGFSKLDQLKTLAKAKQGKPSDASGQPVATPAKPIEPPKTATKVKRSNTAQDYMATGADLMPSALKREMDQLRAVTGSASLIRAQADAKKEFADLTAQALAYKKQGKPIPSDLMAAGREAQDLRDKLDAKVKAQIARLAPQMAQFRQSLIENSTVSREDAAKFANSLEIDTSASQVKKAIEIRKDAFEYYLMTNGGGAGTIQKITKDGDRAYARPWEKSVNIGANPSKAIIFHEMAHHLEAENSTLGDASLQWMQSKATGPLQKLSEITGNPNYKDSEVAYPDHYLSPYIGKVYRDSSGKPRPFSEVISMGVERMADPESMVQFYLQDPEHFMFTLGVMRGKRG